MNVSGKLVTLQCQIWLDIIKHKSLLAQVAFNLPLLQPCCHERCSPQTPITGPARHLALIVIKRRWASASRAVRAYFSYTTFCGIVTRHPPHRASPNPMAILQRVSSVFQSHLKYCHRGGTRGWRGIAGNHEIPETKICSYSARQTVPSFLSRI